MLSVMSESLAVNLNDLRAALADALDLVEQRFGAQVALEVDYYWHLPVDQAFDMTREPTSFTAGQVSDDIADCVTDLHERVPEEASHDLSHLIGVLRALELRTRPPLDEQLTSSA